MKKMKKALSLALVLMMLVSALSVQSFALSLMPLKITGIEFANDNPVSMEHVAAHNWDGVASLNEGYFDYNDKFYDFYVYFSDGDKVLFSEIFDKKDEINGYSYGITVDYDECYNAILNDEETVNVNIELYLHTDKNRKNIEYECTLEKKIVPYIVKNMKPVTALPDKVYRDMYFDDKFADVQFEIEYYGGKKEILSCGYDKGMINEPLDSWAGTGSFIYLDATYEYENETIDPLYTDVKIDDCKFADNHLKEVTFTLTKNDGTTEQYTKTMDLSVADDYPDLGKINGYSIDLYYSNYWPTFTSDGDFTVEVQIGENYGEAVFEPEDVCSCKICHYKGIKYIYYRILAVIWKLFRINEYCACGTWHWHD